jgi:hypothetical protein
MPGRLQIAILRELKSHIEVRRYVLTIVQHEQSTGSYEKKAAGE